MLDRTHFAPLTVWFRVQTGFCRLRFVSHSDSAPDGNPTGSDPFLLDLLSIKSWMLVKLRRSKVLVLWAETFYYSDLWLLVTKSYKWWKLEASICAAVMIKVNLNKSVKLVNISQAESFRVQTEPSVWFNLIQYRNCSGWNLNDLK